MVWISISLQSPIIQFPGTGRNEQPHHHQSPPPCACVRTYRPTDPTDRPTRSSRTCLMCTYIYIYIISNTTTTHSRVLSNRHRASNYHHCVDCGWKQTGAAQVYDGRQVYDKRCVTLDVTCRCETHLSPWS